MGYRFGAWAPYVPVAQRRAQAQREARRLQKGGQELMPVELRGKTIATSFWGKAWCDNLERYSDFENRIPRGRTYVRNGSIVHLEILAGKVKALVAGSSLYKVGIDISELSSQRWESLKAACAGSIGSLLELLQGKLSNEVMEVVSSKERGLFPNPSEISMDCSCPDYATMCKHVAAVLYGVGARLDLKPELLFTLRKVDHAELISVAATDLGKGLVSTRTAEQGGITGDLGELFGVELGAMPEAGVGPRGDTIGDQSSSGVKSPPARAGRAKTERSQARCPKKTKTKGAKRGVTKQNRGKTLKAKSRGKAKIGSRKAGSRGLVSRG